MPQKTESEKSESSFVEMRHIYKTFNKGSVNESVLFTDFSLSVRKGSFVAVVGSNGSGKTTMLNLLCGSIPVDGGAVFI
ncbi:MAG TPA: ABC transporter ATP-binding protein, partial [Clostridiales bacterium]|nr:ABC transporter ATP-binding protein [Clostridiales bacterium]